MIFHGWLGKIEGFFAMDEVKLIEMASCDGVHIGRLESSSECDVAYLRLVDFAQVVFDLGG